MIIEKKTLKNVLFIDIETVSSAHYFHELPESLQQLWKHKSKQFLMDRSKEVTEELAGQFYRDKAAIFAEFGKIVCISLGYLSHATKDNATLRIKSLYGEESDILKSLNNLLLTHYKDVDEFYLCGHNIREFDIPYICRRNIIHGLPLPDILNLSGKKPWQVNHLIDTMALWKFGDYKNFTSLNLLAACLGIPSPKDDIDGSQVGRVYWDDGDVERIVKYCEKDVATVAQVARRFAGLPLIQDERMEYIES